MFSVVLVGILGVWGSAQQGHTLNVVSVGNAELQLRSPRICESFFGREAADWTSFVDPGPRLCEQFC